MVHGLTQDTPLAGVKKLYQVEANLMGVPHDTLVAKKKRDKLCFWKSERYYVCEYDVHLTVWPSGSLQVAVSHGGKILPGSSAPRSVAIQVRPSFHTIHPQTIDRHIP